MIKLRDLLNEEFTAINNKSGKTVVFKNKDSRDAAVKAGTHEVPEDEKGGNDEPKGEKPNMFSKDSGYDAPDAKSEPSKYDDSSFWKDDEKSDSTGIDHYDGDTGDFYDDDDYSEGPRLTSARLDKIETALDDELKLSKRGFSMNRSSGGGGGGFEGPLEITHDDADFDNPEKVAQLSVGSGENNGKFTIGFTNLDGEPLFNDEYSLTDDDFEPQEAHKMAKAIMKMPEVEKLLKGELSIEKFAPIYDKLKAKFNKSSNEGRVRVSEAKATPHLSDNEQKKIAKAIETVTGVSTDYEITDTRYHTGASDFGLDGGQDTMLFVGKYDGGYRISVESNGRQYGFEEAKDFNGAMKSAMKLAKKFKRQLTTESKLGRIGLMDLLK